VTSSTSTSGVDRASAARAFAFEVGLDDVEDPGLVVYDEHAPALHLCLAVVLQKVARAAQCVRQTLQTRRGRRYEAIEHAFDVRECDREQVP
jgi:hypothetical protein